MDTKVTGNNISDGASIRIHRFLPLSYANGPGARAVIWVKGCSLGCPGCFNPRTHTSGGDLTSVDDLFLRIIHLGNTIEGVSVSGGEPLQQYYPILTLLQQVRQETQLSVLVFTGYTWEEVQQMPDSETLLGSIDVLIAGRYDAAHRLMHNLRGSANQTIHFLTDRYSTADLRTVPSAEVIIAPDGEVIVSGVDPIRV